MTWRLCLVFGLILGAARPAPGAFTQEIYVWQRQTGPEVAAALRDFAPRCTGFNVLAAEVSWKDGRAQTVRPQLDFRSLAGLGRPVGLSLRVGAYGGSFAAADGAARGLGELVGSLLAAARAGGLEPAELQIDFDCAGHTLAGYAQWLGAFRRATGRTPLVFTALPAWLDQPDFFTLAAVADGFVLQVHSLERPASPDAPFALCDPVRARRWAGQAARLGKPFRVALPTYGYVLAFDRAGKFLALAAEGPRPAWPAGTQLRVVRADAMALAALARELTASPPANCTGLLWFRLPVVGDRLNWDPITLTTVLRGEIPQAALVTEVSWTEPGLAEIAVHNTGQTTELLPRELGLAWPAETALAAGDGLAGFRLELAAEGGAGRLRVNNFSAEALLSPGRRVKVAWLRFPHESSLSVRLVEVR